MSTLVIDGQEVIVKTYASGKLFAVRYVPETRRPDGKLTLPPGVFALHYDPELDELQTERITWGTATSLAPADIAAIGEAITADRLREAELGGLPGGITWVDR
jgi:hypothetical protein